MERDSISNELRYIVDKKHIGSIFPTKLRDLTRTVFLNNGAEIQGAIFAHSIQINGGKITIDKAVFAKNTMKITMGQPGFINFKSTVAARKSILIENKTENNYIRIKGDLFIENAHLKNMIIYGNIYGKKVILDDTAVLGAVFVEESLEVNHSLIGTFVGTDVSLNDQTTLWLTDGIARKSLNLNGRVRGFSFALPKVFTALLEEKSFELPEETIELIEEDIKVLDKKTMDKYLNRKEEEKKFQEIKKGEKVDQETEDTSNENIEELEDQDKTEREGAEVSEQPENLKDTSITFPELIPYSKDLFSADKTVHYFGLEPRIYNTETAQNSFELNRKMHRILLNPSHLLEEEKFKKFDKVIFNYLKQDKDKQPGNQSQKT